MILPNSTSPSEFTETLNDSFIGKIDNIRKEFSDTEVGCFALKKQLSVPLSPVFGFLIQMK